MKSLFGLTLFVLLIIFMAGLSPPGANFSYNINEDNQSQDMGIVSQVVLNANDLLSDRDVIQSPIYNLFCEIYLYFNFGNNNSCDVVSVETTNVYKLYLVVGFDLDMNRLC
jgi:hypothetical protein